LIRILNAPSPVINPQSARDLNLHPKGGIVEYLAFNLRKDADARSSLPEGTEFHVLLQGRNIADNDWKTLLHTMEVLSWLGSLGTRSRRCFGSLTLLSQDGKLSQRPKDWSTLIRNPSVEVRTVPGIDERDWRELFRQAGNWLREQRNIVANKNRLFGTAGSRQRIASSILLRPDQLNGRFTLLAIGRTPDLDQTSLASPSFSPLPESADP
jgi:hypothetical protein